MANAPIQAPTGTRDFYPIELARRRWIEDKWRRTAIRHGFEEIDGPTFESTELYTKKSGDGIVSEIFGVYSGKDEAAVKEMGAKLAAGERGAIAPYALRPEFTPTLARLYAARAKQLPQPSKWFWQQTCFRAERPQRGRLREFMQWNCDIIGGGSANANTENTEAAQSSQIAEFDAEIIAVAVDLFRSLGLQPEALSVRYNDRRMVADALRESMPAGNGIDAGFALLDKRVKLKPEAFIAESAKIGFDIARFDTGMDRRSADTGDGSSLGAFRHAADSMGLAPWTRLDRSIVRGLAYYTGLVFEVIVDGERAVAGGGRYDNLIETFGGPPTPAVGFGMGDVVLSLVLQDKGLMPTDKQIAADLGLRPDVFVISNGTPEADALVSPRIAELRGAGMHARRSYKATKNIGKLLKEASDVGARYAVIIESPTEVTLKNMDDNTQDKGPWEIMRQRITPR